MGQSFWSRLRRALPLRSRPSANTARGKEAIPVGAGYAGTASWRRPYKKREHKHPYWENRRPRGDTVGLAWKLCDLISQHVS